MFHPSRGGVRGGQDQFSWDNVKEDKYRENYLGHSVKAPVGRWQKGKDLTWYAKDDETKNKERAREIQAIKDAEEDAMLEALGHPVKKRRSDNAQIDDKELKSILQKGNKDYDEGISQDDFEIKGLGFKDSFSKSLAGKIESTTFTTNSGDKGPYAAKNSNLSPSGPLDNSEASRSPKERSSHSKHKSKKKEKKSKSKHKHKHKHKSHKRDDEEPLDENPRKHSRHSPSSEHTKPLRESRYERLSRSPLRSNSRRHAEDDTQGLYRNSRSRRSPSPSRSRYSRDRSRRYSRSRSPIDSDKRHYDNRR